MSCIGFSTLLIWIRSMFGRFIIQSWLHDRFWRFAVCKFKLLSKLKHCWVHSSFYELHVLVRIEKKHFLLSQWLTGFELLGIPYLVGKIKFKLFFQGPLAKWDLIRNMDHLYMFELFEHISWSFWGIFARPLEEKRLHPWKLTNDNLKNQPWMKIRISC